jgi:RHS repeat-associated protein
LESEKRFVYDGWNLVREMAVSGGSDKYFVWGLDLSQSLQGAGGIGGLLCSVDGGGVRHFLYDANGNVGQLVDAADGAVVARYRYDAFGNPLEAEGAHAGENAFRFSTKYFDGETGLYYYGFRYYLSDFGKWISRDPIGEADELNLFEALRNNPINSIDLFGLAGKHPRGTVKNHGNCRLIYDQLVKEMENAGSLLKKWSDLENSYRYWHVRDPRTSPEGTLPSVYDGTIYVSESEWEYAYSKKGQAAVDDLGRETQRYDLLAKSAEARRDRLLDDLKKCMIRKRENQCFYCRYGTGIIGAGMAGFGMGASGTMVGLPAGVVAFWGASLNGAITLAICEDSIDSVTDSFLAGTTSLSLDILSVKNGNSFSKIGLEFLSKGAAGVDVVINLGPVVKSAHEDMFN